MPRKSKVVRYVVSMELPESATPEDGEAYLREAVGAWCHGLRPAGSYGPDDNGHPMRYLDERNITVTRR